MRRDVILALAAFAVTVTALTTGGGRSQAGATAVPTTDSGPLRR
jgi:hypothetical protein